MKWKQQDASKLILTTLAYVHREVPYDPHMQFLFFGEETTMTVRLWTHGWDFFVPPQNVVYHLWSRAYRPTFRYA